MRWHNKNKTCQNCLINKYKASLAITIEPKHISCYSVILPHWSDPVAVANIHTSTSHYSVMALSMNLAWIFKLKDPEKTKQRNFQFVCKFNKPRSTRHIGTRSIDARGGDKVSGDNERQWWTPIKGIIGTSPHLMSILKVPNNMYKVWIGSNPVPL